MTNQVQPKPMSWRNISGTFLLRGRGGADDVTIGPGQIFQARPEDISLFFRDAIKPVDPAELEVRANPPLEVSDPGYKVVTHGKVPGRCNVVDGQGKVVNEQALTATEANKLLGNLSA